MSTLTRRELIRVLGGTAALLRFVPGCGSSSPKGDAIFTGDELAMLLGFADVVIPEDDEPGGAKLGAVNYIEGLINAFDVVGNPMIYGGGPFSDRNPYPDPTTLQAGTTFSENDFLNFTELDRVTTAAWQLIVNGSAGLPNGAPNEALLGPVVSVKDQLTTGLQSAITMAGKSVSDLAAADFERLFNAQSSDFQSLVIDLVTEAAFAAPEYGGNPGLAGWTMCHFEGDILPLGYSNWNGSAHVERPEAPLSTPNASDPEPLTDDIRQILVTVVGVLGGRSS